MDHTYLRYECADTIGLIVSSGSSKGAVSHNGVVRGLFSSKRTNHTNNNDIVVTTTGSTITGFSTKTNLPVFKLGHREQLSGGVGTGRSLNSDEVICIDISCETSDLDNDYVNNNDTNAVLKVATGWMDGTVRVFDIHHPKETMQQFGVVQTLQNGVDEYGQYESSENDDFVQREPLVLNGHTNQSPVRVVKFDNNRFNNKCVTRLASGGSDGTVVLWDIVSESGLYRLIGHRGPITDITFVSIEQATTSKPLDVLISSSCDSLIKIWDLHQQCCIQTIASHRGEVTSVPCTVRVEVAAPFSSTTGKDQGSGADSNNRHIRYRLVTGGTDGQVLVWAIDLKAPDTKDDSCKNIKKEEGTTDIVTSSLKNQLNDNICQFIGSLRPPATVTASGTNNDSSSSSIFSIQYDNISGKYVGVVRGGTTNAKCIDIYRIRSLRQAHQKRQRRLRRRQEKMSKKKAASDQPDNQTSFKAKRGLLDDPDSSSDEDNGLDLDDNKDDELIKAYKNRDPTLVKASDEYEYITTIRCNHKIRGFTFLSANNNNSSKSTMVSSGKMKKAIENGTVAKELIRVVCALSTNAVDVYSIQQQTQRSSNDLKENLIPPVATFVAEKINVMDMYGHPTGIRAIALSSDDKLACTVSKNITKIWNVHNRSCILSLSPSLNNQSTKSDSSVASSLYGLCTAFLPGNTHIVVGTREGHLYIINVSAGDVVHAIPKAHDGAVWSIDIKQPTGNSSSNQDSMNSKAVGIVTGSADKSVKFWMVTAQDDDDVDDSSIDESDEDVKSKSKHKVNKSFKSGNKNDPMLVHTRTLQMADDVVAVRYSTATNISTKKLLFVSTLDCTIKVFFDDTLKLFLSLYGHKLPALAIDGSDDDTILASGGADKTIKIWGLDFGDTHRTLHGHNDSITDIRFVKRTHYFFTCSKDFTVRYWDGDRFEQILLLSGHSAEVNCLSVSRTGAFVLTGGMDRQIRVWERTRDIVFLQEERERELESAFDNINDRNEGDTGRILDRKRNQVGNDDDDEEKLDDYGNEPQSEAAVRKSMLAIASGDRIVESLERADQELKDITSYRRVHGTIESRPPNLFLMGMDPSSYMLYVLRTIKSAELEQTLMVLPHTHVERLMYHLIVLLKSCRGIELCSRVAIFIIKTHQNQVSWMRNCRFMLAMMSNFYALPV
jgi:U3 small nucleolar RNA-associated protein 12